MVELEYDDKLMHGGDYDKEAKDWFFKEILKDKLILHSNEIGDEIGEIKTLKLIPQKCSKTNIRK